MDSKTALETDLGFYKKKVKEIKSKLKKINKKEKRIGFKSYDD